MCIFPNYSLWIPIALVKIPYIRVLLTRRKNLYIVVGTVFINKCFRRKRIKYKNGCLNSQKCLNVFFFPFKRQSPWCFGFSSQRTKMVPEIGRSCKPVCFNFDTSAIVSIKQLRPCQSKSFEKFSLNFRESFIFIISLKKSKHSSYL